MKALLKGIDILFLARPIILVPVWGFSVLGYYCCQDGSLPFTPKLFWGRQYIIPFVWMIIFSLSVGAVYVLNQIADYDVDKENDGFPLLVKSGITKGVAYSYSALLGAISIIIALAFGYNWVAFYSLLALVIGMAYSFKPTYFSGRPIADFLTNAIGYGVVAFGMGWYMSSGEGINSSAFVKSALPYFLIMCGASISSTLPDYPGDKACNKKTTAVSFGTTKAHGMTLVFVILGTIAAFIAQDLVACIIAGAFIIFDILYTIMGTDKLMEATYKVTGGISMLLAGILFPLFAIAALLVLISTVVYFRFRHNVMYPSLLPVVNESPRA